MTRSLDVVVRPARPEDAAAIRDVHERSIRVLGLTAYTPEEVESWAGRLRAENYVEAMTSGGETILVAEADGRVVGFGALKPLEISAVYVAPEVVRRGVGGAVLVHLEELARAEGRRSVRLTATLLGEPFYEAHGYREIDRRKHPTRGGVPIDAVVMEKDLTKSAEHHPSMVCALARGPWTRRAERGDADASRAPADAGPRPPGDGPSGWSGPGAGPRRRPLPMPQHRRRPGS